MALQYPQIFLLLSKRKKLACSRSINLIIFVIDRCLWRPSKAQKDEKLISIFKSAAFGRGRLQWGMTKSAFLVQLCVVVIVLLCFMWLLFHVHVDILLIKQEVLVALTIIGWCEISLESRRRRRRSKLSLKWVHQHKFSEWCERFSRKLYWFCFS